MLVADLKAMANGMGIAGADSMKKAQLVEAITGLQDRHAQSKSEQSKSEQSKSEQSKSEQPKSEQSKAAQPKVEQPKQNPSRAEKPQQDQPQQDQPQQDQPQQDQPKRDQPQQGKGQQPDKQTKAQSGQGKGQQNNQQKNQGKSGGQAEQGKTQSDNQQNNQNNQSNQPAQGQHDDDDEGRGRNRRRRGRDRDRTRGRGEVDTTVLEDDVLVPAAGILDVLDNYAFVRTSGYLPGPDDVYVSLSMVRKYGMRRGDAVTGQVRQPREGERKEKFNPMVRIETVNGSEPDAARTRPEFEALTAAYPTTWLHLETGSEDLWGRGVDLIAPIGAGSRALVVAPPGAGATSLLASLASSVATTAPSSHLMMVLLDERPEEVAELRGSVRGELIVSTFDRVPADHTVAAELALERAKRLVELGMDVVLLLDGLTRLARAYNTSGHGGGRALPGGLDSTALPPVKQFFGAARRVAEGGSLTIVATATAGEDSILDGVVLEELRSTATTTLRLQAPGPRVDVAASGTRLVERLLEPDAIVARTALRDSVLAEGTTGLVERIRATTSNAELLRLVR
ncbi:transcription termination factor Rho [Nocardioides sp. CBS4Y-1]|uniref:Transcription termination factor Rho n=2 Tax=Nocardioides acrostichi TaxID=2784339 RepID=A0A930UXR7_9ACTN|nr:transcription termination factor Rho [Nocardioides acrostichi]